MTNEDAISREDTLKEFKRVYFDNATVIRCAELILGSMPPITPSYNSVKTELEPSEDCISREAIMDLIDEMGDDFYSPREAVVSLDYMADAINELPSVTPSYNSIKSELKPCEDAISRKRLIILIDEGAELHPYKVVGDSETYSNYNQGWTDAFDWLYANIECDNLPSVKPQPKIDEIISRIEEARDKDQIAEYPYNRCIKIIREVLGDD